MNDPASSKKELPFNGYTELIQQPLEHSDEQSYKRIKSLFLDSPSAKSQPFSFLLKKLTGKTYDERKAREHWRRLLEHKGNMEAKLGRTVGVQTAAVDFFSILGSETAYLRFNNQTFKDLETIRNARSREEWLDRIYLPTYYMERLKEEVSRAQRYKHSLSAILLDIDAFHQINEDFSYKIGDEILTLIVKIIKKTIRNVDIIARYSGDRFLVILPNTNEREARELAERLRQSITKRTSRVGALKRGITATLAVSQLSQEELAVAFIRRIEGLLKQGKDTQRDAVYA